MFLKLGNEFPAAFGIGRNTQEPDARLAQKSRSRILEKSQLVAGKLCPIGEKPETPFKASSIALDPDSAQFYNILVGKLEFLLKLPSQHNSELFDVHLNRSRMRFV